MAGLLLPTTLALLFLLPWLVPFVFCKLGSLIGWWLWQKTAPRRQTLLDNSRQLAGKERKKQSLSASQDADWDMVSNVSSPNTDSRDKDWAGIVGFFHPFCNAGGGGERVLWAAIRATQTKWPNAVCVVYTGDHDADKTQIVKRVRERFNITLEPTSLCLLYLSTRSWVLASSWPRFTLLGQSVGSLILAFDAFGMLVPDIFVDTMGFAFSLGLCKLLFPSVPTGAYVHYPTISTDMLESLESTSGEHGLNAGAGAGTKGKMKKKYWQIFAYLYSWVGGTIDVVMTNSSWTHGHILQLWGPARQRHTLRNEKLGENDFGMSVVFPPVAVEDLESQIDVSLKSSEARKDHLLYIAQFRPEKNHTLIITAFSELVRSLPDDVERPKLVLVGSVRDSDDATRVYSLRLLAHELHITEDVIFVCDAPWPQVLEYLRTSSVGVNGMWNEHFGIGVVEYQAAGLISVVNDSGGPKLDIVVDFEGEPTGFHASTSKEYAEAFAKALGLNEKETLSMRQRARESAKRFTEQAFAEKWIQNMEALVALQRKWA